MELRKFPVTAPDGTEYRVEIAEFGAGFCVVPHACVFLYVKRKWFGFRRVFFEHYDDDGGVYNRDDPDYAALTAAAVRDYCACKRALADRKREQAEAAARKQAAVDRFNAWDGRIETEG